MIKRYKITLLLTALCITCMSVLGAAEVFAQKSDSIYYQKRVGNKVNSTPQIKSNIQPFKPVFGFIPYNYFAATAAKTAATKSEKILTVVRVFPNPIDDQINVTLKLEREINLSIKIMDLLGNEVITLSNERYPSGETTRNFNIPNRLNSGIYFLRIVAGAETSVKRISVL